MADDAFPERLWAMADLFTPMAVRVAATLRLADHVAAGADSVPALVDRTGSDPDALARLVDHLLAIGLLARAGSDCLALTDLGDQLRDEHPGGVRAFLDVEGAVGRADLSAVHLLDTVRTGSPAYPLAYGRGFWEDLAAQPSLAESFDTLMGSRLRSDAPAIAAGYEWGTLSHVIDVGGGNGTLLAAILAAHPGLRGTVLDLAGPAEAARRVLADSEVGDRCEVVAASFFEPLPAGADAYILSGVLHDWDDAHALEILRRCTEAAGSAGRVLVIEHCELEGTEFDLRTGRYLRMLAFTGGRERTLADFERLAAAAGLRVSSSRRMTRYESLIELRA